MARLEGVARSEVARTAIGEFLERKARERHIAAFVAEAQAAYADPRIRDERSSSPRKPCPSTTRVCALRKTRVVMGLGQAGARRASGDEAR